jgi:two-component system chemotaxis response regulator CheB
VLPEILGRAGQLPARHPVSGEVLPQGTVLVAPPNHHLAVQDGRVHVTRGPRENGHRPAVDVLFRTAARSAGARVVGVVLSGVLDDGTAGLVAVKQRGGIAVVQDPRDALYPNMPESALTHVAIDHVAPAARIGALITKLCREEIPGVEGSIKPLLDLEAELAFMDENAMSAQERPGRPSGFSCPDCNGVLWEVKDGELVRYRCRVGHAWSADSLLGEQAEQLDTALWMALRGLEEKAALARTLQARASERNSGVMSRRYSEQAEEAQHAAGLIRAMLEAHVGDVEPADAEA